MTKDMKRLSLLAVIVSALAWPSLTPPAHAACSDVPAQDVYWRRCVFDRQDLTDIDVTGAILRDSSFKRADLTSSILQGVDARRAKFVTSILQDVVLDEANLVRADLTKADLKGASLKGANLTWARMFRADLSGADLTGARLDNTDLLQAVLDGATWTDGKTVCAEGSIGRCRRSRADVTPEPTSDVSDTEPPA
jgi:uncharacterized protein YjbI with pentapeptide repeats